MNGKVQLSLNNDHQGIEILYNKVASHIDNARQIVQRAIDTEMVRAYWNIGRDIVEEEQSGQMRAEYGQMILRELSNALNQKYGRGFGISTLRDIRQFYLVYKDHSIRHALRGESLDNPTQMVLHAVLGSDLDFKLGWIHYRALMRISRPQARQFYEIEAIKNNWGFLQERARIFAWYPKAFLDKASRGSGGFEIANYEALQPYCI